MQRHRRGCDRTPLLDGSRAGTEPLDGVCPGTGEAGQADGGGQGGDHVECPAGEPGEETGDDQAGDQADAGEDNGCQVGGLAMQTGAGTLATAGAEHGAEYLDNIASDDSDSTKLLHNTRQWILHVDTRNVLS